MAPIALAPLTPDVSAPLKLTTVIDDATDWASVAVTVTFVSGDAATARQISAVPRRTLVRSTSVHVKPPPLTLTTWLPAVTPSADTNARRSSFVAVVENAVVATV